MIPLGTVVMVGRVSKPRASGDDPGASPTMGRSQSVNPARAGMIRLSSLVRAAASGKPRASGDDPAVRIAAPASRL